VMLEITLELQEDYGIVVNYCEIAIHITHQSCSNNWAEKAKTSAFEFRKAQIFLYVHLVLAVSEETYKVSEMLPGSQAEMRSLIQLFRQHSK